MAYVLALKVKALNWNAYKKRQVTGLVLISQLAMWENLQKFEEKRGRATGWE